MLINNKNHSVSLIKFQLRSKGLKTFSPMLLLGLLCLLELPSY